MTERGSQIIGARLRTAREASGKSLRHIADTTKVSVPSLEALESEKISRLPGGIYRRGIVRAYAQEVGLNPEVVLREFLAQYPDDLPPLPPLPTRKPTSYDPPPAPEVKPVRYRTLATVLSVFGAQVPIGAGVIYFTIGLRGADVARHREDATPRAVDALQPAIVPAGDLHVISPMSVLITVSALCDLHVVADGHEVVARKLRGGEMVRLDVRHEVALSGDDAGAVQFGINGRAGRRLGPMGSPLNVRIARDDYDAWLVQP
jgi:transcriptional regulator with XRE-family HTH domain